MLMEWLDVREDSGLSWNQKKRGSEGTRFNREVKKKRH